MKNHRQKTDYKGVYFTHGIDPATGKAEMIYHIRYRTKNDDGSSTEHTETAGRQRRDNMTPAKANIIRARRMHGDEKPNKIRRDDMKAAKSKKIWTISSLWVAYKEANPNLKGIIVYEATFNTHLSRAFGKKKPENITPFDIDRLKFKQMAGKSDKTISNALELLRRIVNFGIKRGLSPGPGFTIQLPRVHNEKTEDLNPEQMARLLEVINRHIQYKTPYFLGANMMKLALYTGMRRAEFFRLTWDDIDFHRGNILLREPKSGRDEIIPLSSYAKGLLMNMQKAVIIDSSFVFPGMGGRQRSSIQGQTKKLKGEAKLPTGFRPLHGLRHTYASGLISNGVPKDVVARLLTHKGRASVTDRYAHIRDDTLMEAAELSGSLLEQDKRAKIVSAIKEAEVKLR